MNICDKCYGCPAQSRKDFIPPKQCNNFTNAYRCKCGTDMFKFPMKAVCPSCDNSEWIRLSKESFAKQSK